MAFRICNVCGSEMIEGYISEDSDEYFCSDNCLETDLNKCYGVDGWRRPTEEEVKAIEIGAYRCGGYIYAIEDGEEDNLNIYWTDWIDVEDEEDE